MAAPPGPTNPNSSFGPAGGAFSSSRKNIVSLIDVQEDKQYIASIVYSYSPQDPAGHAFVLGRLLIIKSQPDISVVDISPFLPGTPDVIQPFKLFEVTLPNAFGSIEFPGDGFELQPLNKYSVILTSPATAGDVFPLAAAFNGFLNVNGRTINKADPFPKMR